MTENNNTVSWAREEKEKEIQSSYHANRIQITKDNKLFYLLVVCFLGASNLVTIVAAFVLAYQNKDIPNAIVAIGSGAIVALGAIFNRA